MQEMQEMQEKQEMLTNYSANSRREVSWRQLAKKRLPVHLTYPPLPLYTTLRSCLAVAMMKMHPNPNKSPERQ